MTLNFIGFWHYIDIVVATAIGIAIGLPIGYSLAFGKKK